MIAEQKITFLQDLLAAVLREGKANVTSYSMRIRQQLHVVGKGYRFCLGPRTIGVSPFC